jgi:hypothetical protein
VEDDGGNADLRLRGDEIIVVERRSRPLERRRTPKSATTALTIATTSSKPRGS